MENPTSFDLNRAIQSWRENLAQSPAFRGENLSELESHLGDSIATLQTRGLSAEEAFIIATRRIGTGGSLESEFGKVNQRIVWLDRVLWMLIGVQIWGLVASLTGSVARNALSWGFASINYNYKESGLALPIALFSLVQVLVIATSLILCWWLVVRKGERLGARLKPLLKSRWTLMAGCAGLCLFSLIVLAFSYGMHAVLARYLGAGNYGSTAMYFSYSQLIISPIQVVTMVILTLALARKRLRLSQA
jgi:hypothetical protein